MGEVFDFGYFFSRLNNVVISVFLDIFLSSSRRLITLRLLRVALVSFVIPLV